MRPALAAVIGGLCLLTLAACAPSTRESVVDPAGRQPFAPSSWRHWQPDAETPSGSSSKDAVQAPKAVILALHGFNDYSNAFQDFAAYASEHGVAVHAYDQRGFGANPDRGAWPGTARLVGDLWSAVDRLRDLYGDTPLYVLGESMGGAVAIVAATAGEEQGGIPLDVDGLILSAPAVWGGRHMNPFYRFTLWMASSLAPGWTLTGGGLGILPSDNIDMLRVFNADPLVIKGTRTDAIAGLVALMDQALARAPELEDDILLLMGEQDEIIPQGALEDFQNRLTTPSLTSLRYPEGYHMLLRDLQRRRVFEDIMGWIDRMPSKDQVSEAGAAAGR